MPLYTLGKDSQSYPLNEAVWIPEKKKHIARARIIIYDLPTHILVNMLTTISQLPYTRYLILKFCSRRGEVTLKSSDLKQHVSVMCTFEFSTGPVKRIRRNSSVICITKNYPTRHHFV